jgi:hypothetical protein
VFHRTQSDPDSADLRSHLHDVDPRPTLFGSSQHVPGSKAQSAPWHPVRGFGSSNEDVHPYAPLGGTSPATRLTRCESNEYSKLGHYREDSDEAGNAHSSINGIMQWEDSTMEREPPTDSYTMQLVESSSVARSSSNLWSSDDLLSQNFSPITPSSEQDVQTRKYHQEDVANQSMSSPCVGLGRPAIREETSFHGLSNLIEMPEFHSSAMNNPVEPFASTDPTASHVCFVCGKSFGTRSGVK